MSEARDFIFDSPIIAAVKDEEQLEKAAASECATVFLLFGDICNIASLVDRVKDAGKFAVVHIDLIVGLSAKEIAVDFISRTTRADGIISTRASLIRRGRELGLITVLRIFAIDSKAIGNLKRDLTVAVPDVIELLPGLMPKVIKNVAEEYELPVIAGGLISDKEDIIAALSAGAAAISTTNEQAWIS